MPEEKIRKIIEEEIVIIEYTEERINEAIANLTKQIDDLIAERVIWEARKAKLDKEV
jgi:hypothetical protein